MVIEERLAKKVKHRKQITLKVILHESTISKITEPDLKEIISVWIEYKTDVLNTSPKYNKVRLSWDVLFNELPVVKMDNRIKLGDYYIFENPNLFLKVRNPDRLKIQIIELLYKKNQNG